MNDVEKQLDDLEHEASLSLWPQSKTKFRVKTVLRDLVHETKEGAELRQTFMQGLLLPERRQNELQKRQQSNVVQALRAKNPTKKKVELDPRVISQFTR